MISPTRSLWIILVITVSTCLVPPKALAQVYLLQWGSRGSGNGQFDNPFGLATDASGNVYVCDVNNGRVQVFTNNGVYVRQWGSKGSAAGQFETPFALAFDGTGNVYVTDEVGERVEQFTTGGTYLGQLGASGSGDGQFIRPTGIAVD